tara:strand:+ start:528 stop:767 length:240 start_codon:yes stop_codon:yes gene_type:complete
MKIALLICFSFIFIFGLTYYFTGYRSAFEADQQCHYLLKNDYAKEVTFGCDHDLETRQWILFEAGKDLESARVIKRFRY